MNINVAELNITNVSQYKIKSVKNRFIIQFAIDGFPYRLRTDEGIGGLIYPRYIDHLDNNENCKYCENGTYHLCLGLLERKQELFQQLIEHPSIRLEWLYIDHV